MKQILEQSIEINHMKFTQSFHRSVREHHNFQLPLQLRTEPTYIPTSNGELLLFSEYISTVLNSLSLNLHYIHKYMDNIWVEILTIAHAKKVRMYNDTIYAIIEVAEGQYQVLQYDTDGKEIQSCMIENEPDTQINLDSIYFVNNQIVYCYQCFTEQIPYIEHEKYVSSCHLEWRENKDKKLLSVYGFSDELEENQRLWSQSLNMCNLRIRRQGLDGISVLDKEIGIKSFHQVVTLLPGDVMQICYTEPDIIWIKPEQEYEYFVCYVFPDGTIQDCGTTIPPLLQNPFSRHVEFAHTMTDSIYYTGSDNVLSIYEITKNQHPKEVFFAAGLGRLGFEECLSQGKCAQPSDFLGNAQNQSPEYVRTMRMQDKETDGEIFRDKGLLQHIRECGNGNHRENIDSILGLNLRQTEISKLKITEGEQGLSVLGMANGKIFISRCLKHDEIDASETASILFYYDIKQGNGHLIDASRPHKRYVLGNVTDTHFTYFSGLSAVGLGYKSGQVICDNFTGEELCRCDIDSKTQCIGFIEHQGILHILTKNKAAFRTRGEISPTIVTHKAYAIEQ